MKIGIDARFLSHPQHGGFKTYTVNLIASLTSVDNQNDYVLYTDRPITQMPFVLPSNFVTHIVPNKIPMLGMVVREQKWLRIRAEQDQLDVFHAPCLTAPLFLKCPLVVTIHDTIWYQPSRFASAAPKDTKHKMQTAYMWLVPRLAARRANLVITVSQNSKIDLAKDLHLPPDRVVVTPLAASKHYRRVTDATEWTRVCDKFKISPGFMMALGASDSRKNIPNLIRAYARLPQSLRNRFPLVVVWTHPMLSEATDVLVRELNLTGQVHFLRWVDDYDLRTLYSMAAVFAFPSRYEGFGCPPIEAMACGTPVVAANNSSIPEVVGDAALLFDADKPDTICTVLQQLLADENLRDGLVVKGYVQAARFSWDRCARETLSAYRTVQIHPANAPWENSFA